MPTAPCPTAAVLSTPTIVVVVPAGVVVVIVAHGSGGTVIGDVVGVPMAGVVGCGGGKAVGSFACHGWYRSRWRGGIVECQIPIVLH